MQALVSRPVDWAPLAAADPVPGDAEQIQAIGRRHADFAAELQAQAQMLHRLSEAEGWDADAGRRFASTAQEIATDLTKARRRYSVTAQALRRYAPELTHAQREADTALTDARTAQSVISAHQSTEPIPSSATPVGALSVSAVTDAQTALAGAARRLDAAVQHREWAARQAARQIRDVSSHDGLKDSWWDQAKGWTSDRWDTFIRWVHTHAGVIATIANVAGWIATGLAFAAITWG